MDDVTLSTFNLTSAHLDPAAAAATAAAPQSTLSQLESVARFDTSPIQANSSADISTFGNWSSFAGNDSLNATGLPFIATGSPFIAFHRLLSISFVTLTSEANEMEQSRVDTKSKSEGTILNPLKAVNRGRGIIWKRYRSSVIENRSDVAFISSN